MEESVADDPDHKKVTDALRELISTMRPGSKLPSMRAIADQYGVAIGTAFHAVAELQSAGLVEVRRGVGTYVRDFKPIPRSSPKRLGYDQWGAGYAIQDADTAGRDEEVRVETGECPVPDWAAPALGLHPGDLVVYRSRQIVVDERPVQLATSYLPVELARGTAIMYTDTGPGGSYKRLEEIGHKPVRFVEYVRARMPAPAESSLLEIPSGTPVIEITRHAFTENERCVEVNRMILDASSYLLDYTFGAE